MNRTRMNHQPSWRYYQGTGHLVLDSITPSGSGMDPFEDFDVGRVGRLSAVKIFHRMGPPCSLFSYVYVSSSRG